MPMCQFTFVSRTGLDLWMRPDGWLRRPRQVPRISILAERLVGMFPVIVSQIEGLRLFLHFIQNKTEHLLSCHTILSTSNREAFLVTAIADCIFNSR